MAARKFTDGVKRDAFAQVEDRGFPVREVAAKLRVRCRLRRCKPCVPGGQPRRPRCPMSARRQGWRMPCGATLSRLP